MAIFVVQGALIGFIGTAIGVLGGVLLALNIGTVVPFLERLLNVQFLDKSVYYISDLPSTCSAAMSLRSPRSRSCSRWSRRCIPRGRRRASIRPRRCAMSDPAVLSCRGLSKTYTSGPAPVPVLTGVDFAVMAV
jgi:hypothetical protein